MQKITLNLPDSIYRAAYRFAEATQQTLEVVLQNSIASALPPLDDVPPEEAAELAALTLLDDAALWREARKLLTKDEQEELEDLLYRQNAGELPESDKARLETLIDVYGRLMVRKAHAWLILARRGYRVPVQPDQE